MANGQAISRIGWVLEQMHLHASRLGAPVLEAERYTGKDPFKILLFSMLSARTKDQTTIRILRSLLSKAKTPKGISDLGVERLERILFGIGFYRVKSKHLLAICQALAHKPVPDTLDALMELPGVGRKTANIVLARAFGKQTIGVDVHVHRISNRLGIVKTKKPKETETALLRAIPPGLIRTLNRDFVAFGQTICRPRDPLCPGCPLNRLCFRINVREACPECRYGKKTGSG